MDQLNQIILCLLAAVPVLLLIFFLVKLKWSVGRAAIVVVAIDIAIALLGFGSVPQQILVESLKGAWSSLSIIIIIWPAILIYHVVRESGAFRAGWKRRLPGHPSCPSGKNFKKKSGHVQADAAGLSAVTAL